MLIGNKYEIKRKLGSGTFGNVYLGVNKRKGDYVAIKIERVIYDYTDANSVGICALINEARSYNFLLGVNGVPALKWFGQINNYYYMVTELMDESVQDRITRDGPMSPSDTIVFGNKLLSILQSIHAKGVSHRDIKPENIMFKSNMDNIYLIDFGMCTSLREGTYAPNIVPVGTANYMSIRAHTGGGWGASARDDVESAAYTTLFVGLGDIPWVSCDIDHTLLSNEKNALGNAILNEQIINHPLACVIKMIACMQICTFDDDIIYKFN